ncbi:MAG: VanZ family protein [Ardenticatenaceae bacterium]|nr:VanZ family protein [Ardenticatenaceae bacterium]
MLKWITITFGLMILLIIAVANTAPEYLYLFYRVPGGDKFAHFMLTGTMALLLNLTLGNRHWRWRGIPILWGSAAVLIFMTGEEFSQIWLQTRTASLVDLLANISGIVVVGSLSFLVKTTDVRHQTSL